MLYCITSCFPHCGPFFWGFFTPENGQWFSQRRRNSSVPPSPGSFFLCFEFFSCLYRHSPISCLTGPFLSCPLHMRWCVIVHLLCPCQRALIPIFIIQVREAITAVEKMSPGQDTEGDHWRPWTAGPWWSQEEMCQLRQVQTFPQRTQPSVRSSLWVAQLPFLRTPSPDSTAHQP